MNEIINSTYIIEGKIGEGGGGTIYKAWHKRLKKAVVLKKIRQSSIRNEEEKEILKNLKHSYLPQVLDFLETEDGIFTVIDYIEGQSFEKLLRNQKRFSQKKVIKYAIQLCEAVAYLHSQKPPIIHGDIKPANIMLTPEDNICLIDFNISGVLDGKSMATSGCTPGYASPEQMQAVAAAMEQMKKSGTGRTAEDKTELLNDETELLNNETELLGAGTMGSGIAPFSIDVRSDIYSIGATLYHLLTGVMPGYDPGKIIKPSEMEPDIGESISIILMRALSKNPKDRFQTMDGMLAAFQKIHRYDIRYKSMLLRQEMIMISTVICIGIGVALTFFGKEQLGIEKEESYVQAVSLLADAVDHSEEGDRVEKLFSSAQEIRPERLEAYFQKGKYLYQARQYEACIEFIEEKILIEDSWMNDELMSDLYFILANCYFELEQYDHAIADYRSAIKRNGDNPEYYRDYVIALVRADQIEKAEAVLQTAKEKGISSIDLFLIDGELQLAKENYEEAETALMECIQQADDDYVRMRAYVICDKVYRAQYEKAADEEEKAVFLVKSGNLLEEARTRVEMENQLLIYERLAQTYIDLEELKSEKKYGEDAIGVLSEIIKHGWGTYLTYNNMAILYQKIGDLDMAAEVLEQMKSMDENNYVAYKRLAFLEVEKQNRKKNQERSYSDFSAYYDKAKDLYTEAAVPGGDAEMQLLDNLYRQVVEGGWLK